VLVLVAIEHADVVDVRVHVGLPVVGVLVGVLDVLVIVPDVVVGVGDAAVGVLVRMACSSHVVSLSR
jgi:hypothetical protein